MLSSALESVSLECGPQVLTSSFFLPSNMSNALANAVCQRCQARFAPAERIVNSNGELYHEHCFVCAQCFRPFPEGLFYEVSVLPNPCLCFPEPKPLTQLRVCPLAACGPRLATALQ